VGKWRRDEHLHAGRSLGGPSLARSARRRSRRELRRLVGSSAHPSAELVWPEHRRGKGGCGDGREEAEAHTEEEGAVEAERTGEHYHGRRVRRGLIDREVQKVQDEGAF
jgi:hypothetical protein